MRILRKNASAIEDAAGGSSFGSASVSPGATYSELADTLEKILETGTLDGDTKKAYEAQITELRGNAENMNLSVSVQYQSALAMLSQLDDQAYQLRRQADSIANQMAMAAQNLLYTMETLDCQMESLKNGIATLDRNLAGDEGAAQPRHDRSAPAQHGGEPARAAGQFAADARQYARADRSVAVAAVRTGRGYARRAVHAHHAL